MPWEWETDQECVKLRILIKMGFFFCACVCVWENKFYVILEKSVYVIYLAVVTLTLNLYLANLKRLGFKAAEGMRLEQLLWSISSQYDLFLPLLCFFPPELTWKDSSERAAQTSLSASTGPGGTQTPWVRGLFRRFVRAGSPLLLCEWAPTCMWWGIAVLE